MKTLPFTEEFSKKPLSLRWRGFSLKTHSLIVFVIHQLPCILLHMMVYSCIIAAANIIGDNDEER